MWIKATVLQALLDGSQQHAENNLDRRYREDAAYRIAQAAKDAMTIDWMRHRINALEKERAILLNKIAGVIIPVPEIVPSQPGTLSADIPDFASMPSFEDVGDFEAKRLGIAHDNDGNLNYTK